MTDELEVIGEAPSLDHVICDALVCEQYWHQGNLDSPANVIYLKAGRTWHRLTFDCGIIFWRTQPDPPEPHTMPELEAEAKLDDLGVRLNLAGCSLAGYEASAIPGGSQVRFQFNDGRELTFKNVDDATSILS